MRRPPGAGTRGCAVRVLKMAPLPRQELGAEANTARVARESEMRPSRSPTRPLPTQITFARKLSSASSYSERYPWTRAGRISVSRSDAINSAPCRDFDGIDQRASRPRRRVYRDLADRPRKRANTVCSAEQSPASGAANVLRRICWRTPGSHHSRCSPPGRNSPSSSLPAACRTRRVRSDVPASRRSAARSPCW